MDLSDGIEQGLREPVVAHGPILAFDVRVLWRLSRLDNIEVNAARRRPLLASVRGGPPAKPAFIRISKALGKIFVRVIS